MTVGEGKVFVEYKFATGSHAAAVSCVQGLPKIEISNVQRTFVDESTINLYVRGMTSTQ